MEINIYMKKYNIVLIIFFASLMTSCCLNNKQFKLSTASRESAVSINLNNIQKDVRENLNKTSTNLENVISNGKNIQEDLIELEKILQIQNKNQTIDIDILNKNLAQVSHNFSDQLSDLQKGYDQYKNETLLSIEKLQQSADSLKTENLLLRDELDFTNKSYTSAVVENSNLQAELKQQKSTTGRWKLTVVGILSALTAYILIVTYVPSAFTFLFKWVVSKKGDT